MTRLSKSTRATLATYWPILVLMTITLGGTAAYMVVVSQEEPQPSVTQTQRG